VSPIFLALLLALGAARAGDLAEVLPEEVLEPEAPVSVDPALLADLPAVEAAYLRQRLVLEPTPDGFRVGSDQLGPLATTALARRWHDVASVDLLDDLERDMRAASWIQGIAGSALCVAAGSTWLGAAMLLPSRADYRISRSDYRQRDDYLYAREQARLAYQARLAELPQERRMRIEDRAWAGVYLAVSGTLVLSLAPMLQRDARERRTYPYLHYSEDEALQRIEAYNEALLGRLAATDPSLLRHFMPEPPTAAPPNPADGAPLAPWLRGVQTLEAL
jgi:hypothetical protein